MVHIIAKSKYFSANVKVANSKSVSVLNGIRQIAEATVFHYGLDIEKNPLKVNITKCK